MKSNGEVSECQRTAPAAKKTLAAIVALRPDLEEMLRQRRWGRSDNPLCWYEAEQLLSKIREEAKEAAKPKLPTVSVEQAQALHRQSAQALVARQENEVRETAAEHNRRVLREQRERQFRPEPDPTPSGDCVAINMRLARFWAEERRFAAAAERRFREWDECGLYGGQGSIDDLVARQNRRWER
jgi:hypothetical protein